MNQKRSDFISLLPSGCVGIELGVAEGVGGERFMEVPTLGFLYGVDCYMDPGHGVDQYRRALARMEPHKSRYSLLRMKFSEALLLFSDETFDFCFIDGFAHTGQDNGQTLRDWYPKVKKGGILAGDDYSPTWPKTVEQVDLFLKQKALKLNVIHCQEKDTWSRCPAWWVWKP